MSAGDEEASTKMKHRVVELVVELAVELAVVHLRNSSLSTQMGHVKRQCNAIKC